MRLLKKIWKVVRVTLLSLLILVGVLLVFILAGGLGPTVKHVGVPVARAAGLPLSIDKCVILPLGGYVRIEGLKVENPASFVEAKPKPYATDALVQIGMLEADVGMRTLFSKELVIDSLQLTGLRALYAYDLETTNVDALLAQMGIEAKSAEAAEEVAEETQERAEEPEESAGEAKQIRLAYVNLEDNSVSIRKFITVPIPLPPLTLRDVDNHTFAERMNTLIAPVVTAVSTIGSGLGSGIDAVGSGLGTLGEGAANIGSGALDAIGSGFNALVGGGEEAATSPEEAKQDAKSSAKDLKSGIKGLFK